MSLTPIRCPAHWVMLLAPRRESLVVLVLAVAARLRLQGRFKVEVNLGLRGVHVRPCGREGFLLDS